MIHSNPKCHNNRFVMNILAVSGTKDPLIISTLYLVSRIGSFKLIYYWSDLASPESIETTFSLHTRRNPIEGEPLDYNDNDDIDNDKDSSTDNNSKQIHNSFNGTNSVKIIIHGFGSSSKRPWVQKMTEVLLQLDDFNIINVDWQNGSKLPNYVQAAGESLSLSLSTSLMLVTSFFIFLSF